MARITQKLNIEVHRCVTDSPFYVTWLNPVGGWDFWLFDKRQQYGGNITRSGEYEVNNADIRTATAVSRHISTTNKKRVKCFADQLTTQEIQGLETLLQSPSVYWLKDLTNEVWVEVKPLTGSYELYNTDEARHEFEVTFELPETFIQSN